MRETALALPVLAATLATPFPAWAIANPASQFCVHTGGRSEILPTVSGARLGICILPGGEIVEEWAYFRARHPPAPSR